MFSSPLPPLLNLSSSSSPRCLSERSLRLSAHFVEKLFMGILLPPLICLGVVGNCLTLFVLLNQRIRTRSNTLLAALAFLDMVFLLLMLPNSLAHFELFWLNNFFRRFYSLSKIHLLALINQCSAAAIWPVPFHSHFPLYSLSFPSLPRVMLGICLERLSGIRDPLGSRKSHSTRTGLFIVGVLVATFWLTFYNHLSYNCLQKIFCNGTQTYFFCHRIDSRKWLDHLRASNQSGPSDLLSIYVRLSPLVHALLVVFLPMLVIIFSNLSLLWTLRRQRDYSLGLLSRLCSEEDEANSQSLKSSLSQQKNNALKTRIEHRVTLTVAAIVTSFTLTQTPSAVVQLVTDSDIGSSDVNVPLRTFTFFLVALGKCLNFVLFCLSSANFRLRLVQLVNARLRAKRSSKYPANAACKRPSTTLTTEL